MCAPIRLACAVRDDPAAGGERSRPGPAPIQRPTMNRSAAGVGANPDALHAILIVITKKVLLRLRSRPSQYVWRAWIWIRITKLRPASTQRRMGAAYASLRDNEPTTQDGQFAERRVLKDLDRDGAAGSRTASSEGRASKAWSGR